MNSLDLELARALDRALDDKIDTFTARVVAGFPTDYSEYREAVGQLWAFRDVKLLLRETTEGLLRGPTDKQRQMA